MDLIRTRPFRPPADAEALFGVFPRPAGHLFGFRESRPADPARRPRVDILESDAALTLRYSLAGFALEDIEVTLENGLLTVEGARAAEAPEGNVYRRRELPDGEFTRSIRVGGRFDPERVQAKLAGGILEVVLEKRPEVLPRTIPVQAA